MYTADPTWSVIFECCFKAQSSKLECLFPLKRGKRDVRTLSFELSKMSPQDWLYVHIYTHIYIHTNICTARSVEDETRNDHRNAKRNPNRIIKLLF